MQLQGRRTLVTGGSRGIGRAIAMECARQGAAVVVHYHGNREAAEATRASLPGGPHHIAQADVADSEACERLVTEATGLLGGLDILINNAGIYELHRVLEVDYDEWQASWHRTLATNLLGPANLMFLAARAMAASGGGRIVNISSRGAFRGEPEGPAYGASKAGLNALSQSLALALAPHGVFVGVVAPGFVETDMAAPYLEGETGEAIRAQSPLGRAAAPEEIARAAVFLAGDGIEYLTGCIIDANGASYLRT
jgi:3-oxoacyl-[acyl-carrier protein] reductase